MEWKQEAGSLPASECTGGGVGGVAFQVEAIWCAKRIRICLEIQFNPRMVLRVKAKSAFPDRVMASDAMWLTSFQF